MKKTRKIHRLRGGKQASKAELLELLRYAMDREQKIERLCVVLARRTGDKFVEVTLEEAKEADGYTIETEIDGEGERARISIVPRGP